MNHNYIHKTAKKNYSFFSSTMKFMLFTALMTFLSFHLSATVSSYSFFQTTGTFTTIVGQQGAVSIAATAGDNNIYNNSGAGYPIGFTFKYNGNNFTTFSCVDDGYIQLGSSLNTDPTIPLSSLSNCISAMGCNLYNVSGGRIDYLLSGTAPGRILTIQWSGMSMKTDGLAGHLNFQIQLFESSNMVQIVYGSCGTSSATSYTPQAGMTGSTTSDFIDRTHTTGWPNTSAGGTNGATITYNSTYNPSSGLTYSWSPYCLGGYSSNPCGVNTATGGFSVNGTTYQHACNIGSTYPTITYIKNYIGLAGVPTLTVNTGYTMTLYLPQGSSFSNSTWFYVWVDWNNSGSLTDDASKFTSVKLTSGTSVTTTLSVPSTATDGGHLIRIRSENGSNSQYAYTTACGAYSQGTQDDYAVNVTGGNPMTYSSSTTAQLNDGVVFAPGSTTNQIIQVQVVTTGGDSPFNMTSMVCNTNGSTAPVTDISNAKMYYTGTSSTFSSTTQYGSAITSPNGAFTFTGSQALATGTNYFWLTYDITSTPTYGDAVDACCNSIVMDGSGGTHSPAITCPAGNPTVNIIYCTPSSTNGSNSGDGISNIFLSGNAGGINTSPTNGNTTSYTNWQPTTNTTVTLTQGSGYTLMMTSYTSANDYFGAWADWDNSGSFTDNGNKLITNNSFPGIGNTQFSVNFNVPAGATIGTHRLRTRCVNGATPVAPCTAYSTGVANDFTITVVDATPIVTSYSQNSDCIGNTLTITGSNLNNVTSVTFFNNINAPVFTIVNNTIITVTIPSGTTTGVIKVTNPTGTGTGPVFTINGTNPVITTDGDQTASTDSDCQAMVSYNVTTNSGTFTYSFSGVTSGSGNGTGSSSIFNKGVTNVVLTASNGTCNQTAGFYVIVNDDVAPVIVTPAADTSVETDGAGNVDDLYQWIIVNWGNADARDNCSDTTYLNLHWYNDYTGIIPGCGTTGTTGVVGFHTIDESGNASEITYATFTIIDTVPPEITCPSAANISADAGSCLSSVSIGTATGFDVGSDVTITFSPSGPYPVGPNTVIWTATDACGNSSSCPQSVNVTDNQNPVITCLADQSRATNSGPCVYMVSGNELNPTSVLDNCSASSSYILSGATSGSGTNTLSGISLNPGITTISWTAADGSGNTASCSFTATINPTAVTLPYNETFATQDCWSVQHISGTGDWSLGNTMNTGLTPVSGEMMVFPSSTAPVGSKSRLVSPLLNFTGVSEPVVNFHLSTDNGSQQPDSVAISISTDGGGTFTFLRSALRRRATSHSWTLFAIDLAPYANMNNIKIAFDAVSAGGGNDMAIDDLNLFNAVCPEPINCNSSNVGINSATVNWLSGGGSPSDFVVRWSTSISDLATWNQVTLSGNTTSYTITGIAAHTTIYWQVKSDCSGNTSGFPVVYQSFQTLMCPNSVSISSNRPNLYLCYGGTITLTATGGFTGYSWSNLATSQGITISSASTYSVTVSDIGCNSVHTSVTITQDGVISLVSPYYFNQVNVTCFGGNNGIINVKPAGGYTPYTYVWSPINATTPTVSGLTASAYTVIVTDAKGCTNSKSTTIGQPSQILIGAPQHETQTNPTCLNGHNGIIRMNPAGGIPPYSYTWSPNVGTTATVSNLSAGTYNVTVTDVNNCTRTNSIVLVCTSRLEEPNEDASVSYDFNVYPNPTERLVTISFLSDNENTYSLKLIDMMGRIIKTEVDNASVGENSHIMNLDGIVKGIYMILLQKGDNTSKAKIVVE